jgi:hypothetical protein
VDAFTRRVNGKFRNAIAWNAAAGGEGKVGSGRIEGYLSRMQAAMQAGIDADPERLHAGPASDAGPARAMVVG